MKWDFYSYYKFSLVNKTLPINSLAIGQLDVNPSIQSVTIRGLEGQKYDSELNNPSNLMLECLVLFSSIFSSSHCTFTYNIISEEKRIWHLENWQATQSDNTFCIIKLFYIRILSLIALVTIITFITGAPQSSI
jgi:ABC-2 type transport system permease protein